MLLSADEKKNDYSNLLFGSNIDNNCNDVFYNAEMIRAISRRTNVVHPKEWVFLVIVVLTQELQVK